MAITRQGASRFTFGFVVSIFGALLVLVVWLTVTGLQAKSAASSLAASAAQARNLAAAGDFESASDLLPVIGAESARLTATLTSAPWSWIEGTPVVGDTVASLAVLAASTDAVLSPLAASGSVRSAAARLGPDTPIAGSLTGLFIFGRGVVGELGLVASTC